MRSHPARAAVRGLAVADCFTLCGTTAQADSMGYEVRGPDVFYGKPIAAN